MAKSKSKGSVTRPAMAKSLPNVPPLMSYRRGKGLLVSIKTPFPETADDKITCAKSVIQAVIAAHDAEALQGENYDIHWPLSLAVELLDRASHQLDEQAVRS
jgi:hypothetical protein